MNVSDFTADRTIYCGAYDGKIYKQDDEDSTNDVSEGFTIINAFWRSGWLDFSDTLDGKTPQYCDLVYAGGGDLDFTFAYGFDFNADRVVENISASAGGKWGIGLWGIMKWGGGSNLSKFVNMKGTGKFIQFLIKHNTNSQIFNFNGMSFGINTNEVRALRS